MKIYGFNVSLGIIHINGFREDNMEKKMVAIMIDRSTYKILLNVKAKKYDEIMEYAQSHGYKRITYDVLLRYMAEKVGDS